KPSKVAVLVGVAALLAVVGSLIALFYSVDDWWPLVVVPLAIWLIASLIFMALPDDKFHRSRLNPVIANRYTSILRVGVLTSPFSALTVATKLTGSPYVGY